jgi:hypothetical protein
MVTGFIPISWARIRFTAVEIGTSGYKKPEFRLDAPSARSGVRRGRFTSGSITNTATRIKAKK